MTDTFCPIPWDHISTRANGDLRVCCQCVYGDQAVLKRDDGTIHNGNIDNIETSRNAQIAKDIRKDLLNGVQHPACKLCWDEEAIGTSSKRRHANIMGLITEDEARAITDANGAITAPERPIAYYDLRFGNKCNLKCRSCGPADSTQWYDDWVEVFKNTQFGNKEIGYTQLKQDNRGKWVTINDTYTWYENSALMAELMNNLPHVKRMYFTGGEPTIIHEHMELLEKCINMDVAKNIHLEYNSNMAKLPERLISMWEEFQQVSVGCSIDGMGKVAEYLRHPCKWDVVYKNLLALESTTKGNIGGSFAPTISLYNFLHFADMIQWQISQKFKRLRRLPSSHLLKGPHYMTVQVLPLAAKEHIRDRYNELYDWVEDNYGTALRNQTSALIEPYIDFMFEEDNSYKLKEFWKITKKVDIVRNEKFETVFPELYEFIKGYI